MTSATFWRGGGRALTEGLELKINTAGRSLKTCERCDRRLILY